jgi:uncharacterized protein
MRLFLDANVIFSAALSEGGRARALFFLQEAGACELIASPHAIEEARRNIALKHARRLDELGRLVRQLKAAPEAGWDAVARAQELGLPANDAPILAAAIASGAQALVTGDSSRSQKDE